MTKCCEICQRDENTVTFEGHTYHRSCVLSAIPLHVAVPDERLYRVALFITAMGVMPNALRGFHWWPEDIQAGRVDLNIVLHAVNKSHGGAI